METAKTVAKILLDIKAVTLNTTDPYWYSSGILSPIYCDNRLLMGYPKHYRAVRDAYIRLITKHSLSGDRIGGTATAGIPHAAWIADKLSKPMVYIRSKSKGYGKNKLVEGEMKKGDTVLVIEDLISTGGSVIDAIKAVREEGGTAENCIAIFTYELRSAKEQFSAAQAQVYTITNLTILLEVALQEDYITGEDQEKILEWAQDPKKWGKKMGFES